MSKVAECQQLLFDEAAKKGFLTFDDIMDMSDTYSLSVSEVDQLSEALQLRGIIIYETAPLEKDLDRFEDYSRIDYDVIFKEIVSLSDELEYIVELIKKLPPPQYGEISALTAQIADGNTYARERLILIHLRIVLKIALSMAKAHHYNIVDAVSAGFIGLIIAVDRFDPDGFSAFQSYASLWIQQNINRECNPVWIEYYFPAHYKEKMLPVYERYLFHSCENCGTNRICRRLIAEISEEMDIIQCKPKNILVREFDRLNNISIFKKTMMGVCPEYQMNYSRQTTRCLSVWLRRWQEQSFLMRSLH